MKYWFILFCYIPQLLALEGFQYHKLTTPKQQIVHIAAVDPQHFHIKAVPASEDKPELAPLTEIAEMYDALLAINGGFFTEGEPHLHALPAGILKMDHHWYGLAYQPRAAIGWSNDPSSAYMDRVQTLTQLSINEKKYPVQALNQPAHRYNATLYTDAYHEYVLPKKLTHAHFEAITLENHQITAIDEIYDIKLTVPHQGWIYMMGPRMKRPTTLTIQQDALLSIDVIPQHNKEDAELWKTAEYIVGGAPLLIYRGQALYDFDTEHLSQAFIQGRHARTALGLAKNGYWVFVVVEKNILGSPGMTLMELTQCLIELGCEYALNLDGGSSSGMFLEKNLVSSTENSPEERPIANAIIVTAK
jgi:exopolysaccharide biosynthesis protein